MALAIGEVEILPESQTESESVLVEWRIHKLFYPCLGKACRSASFEFAETRWHFLIKPKGDHIAYSDFISLYLVKEQSSREYYIQYKRGLKEAHGTISHEKEIIAAFVDGGDGWGWYFLSKAELEHYEAKLDVLTITCSMRCVEPDSVTGEGLRSMSNTSSHPFGYGQTTSNSLGMGAPSLQQTQRSLSGQQLPTRTGGNGTHVQGHVTPTSSGMPSFSPCLPNSLPPQQPSPNSRSMLWNTCQRIPTNRSMTTQDMKRIVSIGGPLGGNLPPSEENFNKRERSSMFNVNLPASDESFNKRERSSMFNVSSIAAIANRTNFSQSNRGYALQGLMNNSMQPNNFSTSPALDLSEFPSLTNRNTQENSNSNMSHNPMAGRPPYVGMVKQPTNESNEFQIHSEDFPALPGSQNQDNNQENVNKSTPGRCIEPSKDNNHYSNDKSSNPSQKRGIQISKDGRVTNIPPGMVTDQFGMVGLLTFIRAAEADPQLISVALGCDLMTLGLNLNTSENLYPNFGGPWAEHPCRPQDIGVHEVVILSDYHVPAEYMINQNIKDKLAPVKLNRYGEDLLFYLFYMFSGDVLQVAAAAELYNRDWRFHKDERVWITRVPGMNPTEKCSTYERGMYYFFDADNWRKVAKEFHLDYERLEDRPIVPPAVTNLASTPSVIS